MSKSAPSVERAIYPAGRAVHFLAATDETMAGRRFQVAGNRATVHRFGRLALILRYVDAREWSGEALVEKRADPAWLRAQASLTEQFLDRAMLRGVVLPAPFPSVYDDIGELETLARERYGRWRRTLVRVAGKEEWTLHVFRGPHALPGESPYVLRCTKSRGRAGSLRAPGVDPTAAEYFERLWNAGAALAPSPRGIEPAPQARTVFGAAFLVPSGNVEAFREAIERLAESGRILGLSTYLEGPRPPYTFV